MHSWKHCNIYTVCQGSGNISHNMGMVRMQEVEDKEKRFKMLSSAHARARATLPLALFSPKRAPDSQLLMGRGSQDLNTYHAFIFLQLNDSRD